MWTCGPDQTSSGDTQKTHKGFIHYGEPKGSEHWVPVSTLPAPAQVLLSFAAGQILTFFHSLASGTESRALAVVSFLWEAGQPVSLSACQPRAAAIPDGS